MSDQIRDENTASFRTVEGVPLRIVIDGAYLRRQARDAMLTFIAPLNGVYMAATGVRPASATRETPEQK